MPRVISRLTLIGVGLIGGSLARALKRAGYCGEVVGTDTRTDVLQRAMTLQVIDRGESDVTRAVQGADVVILAVPVGATESVLRQIAPHIDEATIITDVGSVKGCVIAAAKNVFGTVPANFVPGHPIAGTENSGVEASFAELFDKRRVILTPTDTTSPAALKRVRAMWEQAGAECVEMSAEHHDEVLAATSHLPHLLAYTLVDTLVQMDASEEIFRFAAGGFRDFTRIAKSHPRMWRDICLANKQAILTMLKRFSADLETLSQMIEKDQGEDIESMFTRAKAARDRFRVE